MQRIRKEFFGHSSAGGQDGGVLKGGFGVEGGNWVVSVPHPSTKNPPRISAQGNPPPLSRRLGVESPSIIQTSARTSWRNAYD